MRAERPRFRSSGRVLRAAGVVLTGLLFSISLAEVAAAQSSPQAPFVSRPEEELLLFEVVLGRTVLSGATPGYPNAGGILLPLGEISRLLEFAIEVDVAKGTARGFFIDESRGFALDVSSRRVVIGGKESTFDRADVEVHQDDIYVDTRLLQTWWPIDFQIDLYASQIAIKPRESLPMQLREERHAMIRKSLARLGYAAEKPPRVPNPYALFDGPFIDQSLQLFGGAQRDVSGAFQYATLASADVLYHQADVYLTGNEDDPLARSRVRLGRWDPDGTLLGPLGAREYAVGDVLSPGIDLLLGPTSGDGVLLSNFPLQRQNRFDRHTFRGDLPPGWEVELYQNDSLIAYQQGRPDGLYVFEDVPLLFGQNIFRLVFHGPQGQTREEVYRFNVGESLVPAGRLYYRLATDDPELLDRRSSLELDYGVSKRLSLDLAVADADTIWGEHAYAKLGASAFWRAIFVKAAAAREKDGGQALQLSGQARVGPLNLTAEHAELDEFVTEVYPQGFGALARTTMLRGDVLVHAGKLASMPLSLEVRRDELESGGAVWRVQQRLGGQVRRLFFSNYVNGTLFDGVGSGAESQLFGSLLLSRQLAGIGFRGNVAYSFEPDTDLRSVALVAESYLVPRWILQAGITEALDANDTTLSMSANRRDGPFAFGATLAHSDREGFSVAINLFTGVARDSWADRWHAQARGAAAAGAVSAFVFLDLNGNGRFDPGERPLQNVGFFVNRASSRTLTNENGVAFFPGLAAHAESELAISTATLEDALWRPGVAGVSVLARPGKTTRIEFPVVVTGEITGTAYLATGDGTREASGLKIELVDRDATPVASATTAFDGFFEMTGIAAGDYLLRIEPGQRERLGLSAAPIPVRIEPTGTIRDGLELIATKRSVSES